jgi:hypothetical protein
MLGRLFECFQERIEGFLGEHVDFVDDVDFEPYAAGADSHVLAELTDFVDAAVAGAIDFDYINVVSGSHAEADVALAARGRRWTVHAV